MINFAWLTASVAVDSVLTVARCVLSITGENYLLTSTPHIKRNTVVAAVAAETFDPLVVLSHLWVDCDQEADGDCSDKQNGDHDG
jgi:hypothetical protein